MDARRRSQSRGSSGGSVSQHLKGPCVSRLFLVCLVHLLTRGAHCAGSQMRVPAASAAMRDAARCSASAWSAGHDACHERRVGQVRGEETGGRGGRAGGHIFCDCAEGKPRKEAMGVWER